MRRVRGCIKLVGSKVRALSFAVLNVTKCSNAVYITLMKLVSNHRGGNFAYPASTVLCVYHSEYSVDCANDLSTNKMNC